MGKRKCIATIKKYKKRCGPCAVGVSDHAPPQRSGGRSLCARDPVVSETESSAPVAQSYNFEDMEGKVCVTVGDGDRNSINWSDAESYNYQSGRHIPCSKHVMLDAVKIFCDWIGPAFSTKEIRMYLPHEHLSTFQKIAELMGKNTVLQKNYVLVVLK